MNLAHYNISIEATGIATPNAQRLYKSQVEEHLRWIHRTNAGRVLLDSIRFHGKKIEIQPYGGGNCNAVGGWRTTGAETKGIVAYSPGTFSPHNNTCGASRNQGGRGLLFDEILFHELFHAFRGVSGKWNQVALAGAMTNYTDTEEFFAVLTTNIYISDKSNKIKSGLRASHAGFRPLGHPFTQPWGFFARGKEVFPLVEQLYRDNNGLFIRMANDVKGEFNPFADYLLDKNLARETSQQATTFGGVAMITLELLGLL